MNVRGKLIHLGLVAGLLATIGAPSLAQQSWAGGTENWNADDLDTFNFTNWEPDGIPEADFGDSAVVGSGTAIVDASVKDVLGLELGGTVDIRDGGSLKIVGQEGTTTIEDGGTLMLSGDGAFETGLLANDGLLHLVGQDVSVKTRRSFSHQGSLQFDIGSEGNPVLDVGGAATLNGTVTPVFAEGIELAFGDSFEFLKGASVAGSPAVVPAPDAEPLPRGLSLQVVVSDDSAAVTVGNLAVLGIDRATGEVTISNPVGGPLSLTGYSIGSDNGLLDLDGWSSLNAQGVADWTLANPFATKVAELNLSNESTIDVGGDSLALGTLFQAEMGVKPGVEDVTFEFSTLDGRVLNGLVEYTGPVNDLVLRVDPETGEAEIRNLSTHVDPFDVTGYSILSASSALSVEGWTSFEQSGQAGDGWVESTPRADALAELNLTNSQSFGTGTKIALGQILADGADQDLVFEFATLAGDVFFGTVEYGELGSAPLLGDCNGDGVLNADDLACVTTIEQRDAVLAALNTLPGDLDGDGAVAFGDFLVLSTNFGDTTKTAYTEGDVDLADGVAFGDFLVLSNNFGQVPAAAVPEPSAWMLLSICGLLIGPLRRKRRA